MSKLLDIVFRLVALVILARLFWPYFLMKPLQAFIGFILCFVVVCVMTPSASGNN